MAVHYKTQGIILKKKDQGETSRVLKVFCKEYGKLTMFAQSERKITSKLRGGLNLFSLSQLEFIQGKNKKVLVEAVLLAPHFSLLKDPARLQTALVIADTVDKLWGEQEQDKKVWELLTHAFGTLQDQGSAAEVYRYVVPKLQELAGYGKTNIAYEYI
jgi:DNA repair protein RecO (recombination protein O)